MINEILDEIPYGIAKFNLNGEYLYFNKKEKELRKLSDDFQTHNIFNFFKNSQKDKLQDMFNKLILKEKKKLFFEYKKGTKYYQMRLAIDKEQNIVSTLTNITELKTKEKEIEEYIRKIESLESKVA